jgi:hypothetical protein
MHMNELVSLRQMTTRDEGGSQQQEPDYAEKIGQRAALIDLSSLNADDVHAIRDGASGLTRSAQSNNVYHVTTLD